MRAGVPGEGIIDPPALRVVDCLRVQVRILVANEHRQPAHEQLDVRGPNPAAHLALVHARTIARPERERRLSRLEMTEALSCRDRRVIQMSVVKDLVIAVGAQSPHHFVAPALQPRGDDLVPNL
jgi:hypothetical protein